MTSISPTNTIGTASRRLPSWTMMLAVATCLSLGTARAQQVTAAANRWWQEGVIYQVYPRSFQDTNGDGVGDLRGITRRLDYLQWLGVDAIWISPFFPSPMKDFGYDVADFTGVDPAFGTLADFKQLTHDAHARGIRVILDFVGNHSSNQHPWFQASRRSRTDRRHDWYVWRDPAPDGGPPNNWYSIFGGSAWTRDTATGQYYYHQFLREQPDLNWRSPALRRAMYDAMRFWFDRGADGFRLDAIPHFVEDSLFRDNPPNPAYHAGDGDRGRQLWQHTFDLPATHDIACDMRHVADAYAVRDGRGRVLIGETGMPPEQLMAYYGRNGCGLHLPTNFSLQGAPWRADTIRSLITAYVNALGASASPSASTLRWPNYVLGNHDNPRLATRLGLEGARAAAVLLLTLRGTPTIYYGDELGMHDVAIPQELVQDPAEREQPGKGFGRDPERTPMQWSSDANAGFTTGRPWLPVPVDANTTNVATARKDSTSTLALYKRLLTLRRAEPVLSHGSFRMLPRQGSVLAYVRGAATVTRAARSRFLVLVNFSKEEQTYELDERDVAGLTDGGRRTASLALGTRMGRTVTSIKQVTLSANEAVVIRLRSSR